MIKFNTIKHRYIDSVWECDPQLCCQCYLVTEQKNLSKSPDLTFFINKEKLSILTSNVLANLSFKDMIWAARPGEICTRIPMYLFLTSKNDDKIILYYTFYLIKHHI